MHGLPESYKSETGDHSVLVAWIVQEVHEATNLSIVHVTIQTSSLDYPWLSSWSVNFTTIIFAKMSVKMEVEIDGTFSYRGLHIYTPSKVYGRYTI